MVHEFGRRQFLKYTLKYTAELIALGAIAGTAKSSQASSEPKSAPTDAQAIKPRVTATVTSQPPRPDVNFDTRDFPFFSGPDDGLVTPFVKPEGLSIALAPSVGLSIDFRESSYTPKLVQEISNDPWNEAYDWQTIAWLLRADPNPAWLRKLKDNLPSDHPSRDQFVDALGRSSVAAYEMWQKIQKGPELDIDSVPSELRFTVAPESWQKISGFNRAVCWAETKPFFFMYGYGMKRIALHMYAGSIPVGEIIYSAETETVDVKCPPNSKVLLQVGPEEKLEVAQWVKP